MPEPIVVRELQPADAAWAAAVLTASWGSTRVVTRGRLHDATLLPGLVATIDGQPAGLLTYRIADSELEVVTLNSLREGTGIGGALITAAVAIARRATCRRVWLITTNDNLAALRFYQKRGFRLAALYPDAIAASRRLKPEIPCTGRDGIALRDELELELDPSQGATPFPHRY